MVVAPVNLSSYYNIMIDTQDTVCVTQTVCLSLPTSVGIDLLKSNNS